MAWYAELKRRRWYCINGGNAIRWYKRKLYDEWWTSLSEEEKAAVEENRKRAKEKRERAAKAAVGRLLSMTAMMAGLSERTGNKYGDLYDEYGFLRR